MAFVELFADPQLPLFCNVHAPVGPRAANNRTDVLLVQYLLKVWFEGAPAPVPAGGPLKVDGFAGPTTFAYIQAFQSYGKGKGYKILPDGRVDRAQGAFGSATGSQYTILHLNNAFNSRRPSANRHVWSAADCPLELRDALVAASRPSTRSLVVETHGGGV